MSNTASYDREILIAEYTLGLLNPQDTSQAQKLLGEDALAAATALKWEQNFLDLVDLLPPVNPGPQSLQRLQATLGHTARMPAKPSSTVPAAVPPPVPASPPLHTATTQATPGPVKTQQDMLTVAAALRTREKSIAPPQNETTVTASGTSKPTGTHGTQSATASTLKAQTAKPVREPESEVRKGNIWLWRIASGVFAAIAIVLGLMPGEPVAPPITVVEVAPTRAAIMQAPGQSSTPGWVVTVDPQGNVLMNPQVRSDIPADASVQLWTYNKTMAQPRSLGLIDINQPVTVPATLMGEIGPDQLFEMTQEPAGGSPTASPSGPILFIGRIVTFGRPAVNRPADGLAPSS